jgi:hypothetical protein
MGTLSDFSLTSLSASPPAPGTGGHRMLDDFYSFDPATMVWSQLSAAESTRPSARCLHGFTSTGGKLYVHGGVDNFGMYCA